MHATLLLSQLRALATVPYIRLSTLHSAFARSLPTSNKTYKGLFTRKMADFNHLGDYTVTDMLSTLEPLTELACNYTVEKPLTCVRGSFHYLMAAVNCKLGESDDTRPFFHHPDIAPVLPVIPAGNRIILHAWLLLLNN